MSEITPIRSKWAGTMSDRERFNRQIHFKSVDRCFNMEFGWWEENYSEWKVFRDNNIKHEWQGNILFNFDKISGAGENNFICPGFEHKVLERHEGYNIVLNHDGVICKEQNTGHATIPHYIRSSVETPDDWKRVKEERFIIDDPRRIRDIAEIKAYLPDDRDFPAGIDCGSMIGRVRDMLTFEGLSYACADYPEMVEDMVETCCQLVEASLDRILPHVKFDYASGWEDICFRSGPLVTVDFFKEVVTPRYKRIRRKLDQYGIDIWYTDCDGDVRPILEHLMEGGINALFPFEVNGCAHPGELLDMYPGALRIFGGVDKLQMRDGPAAIKKYLESLEKYVARGGYIPFCDHRCPPDVSEENYFYYLDLKEKMFGMQA